MTVRSLAKLDPDVRLFGHVDESMLDRFLSQYAAAASRAGPLVIEVCTLGGDADIGRRIAVEIRLGRDRGRDIWLLGKTTVYSAGVTILAAVPVDRRFLTGDTVLLVHERKIDKKVHFRGPLRAGIALAHDVLAEIENGQRLERAGFEQLVAGSRLPIDELMQRMMVGNWYLTAQEALDRGLVAGIV